MRTLALLAAFSLTPGAALGSTSPPLVVVARIETGIHPAAASYLKKVLEEAEKQNAALVVLTLSTEGGLLASTREMSSAILLSKVPVVTFVSPSGAQAASAGFFLLLSGDVAAMAPGTNTGAAHPVGGEGQDLPKTLGEKAEQDARAFVRTLAKQRGRSVEKAEAAVSKSASYTEAEARDGGLVEIVARDVPDLVAQLDGRKISRVGGGQSILALKGFRVQEREMGPMEKILGVVSHPNVAYVLFLLGLVGLYFELSTPGADPSRRCRGDLAPPGPLRVLGSPGQPRGPRPDPLRDSPLRRRDQGRQPRAAVPGRRHLARGRLASALLR